MKKLIFAFAIGGALVLNAAQPHGEWTVDGVTVMTYIGDEPAPVSAGTQSDVELDAFASTQQSFDGEVDAFAFDLLESDEGLIRSDKPRGYILILR